MMRSGRLQLGMPQLSGVGLSETWLLEQCGDLHWAMICDRLGSASHELRDGSGQRIYPSFVALRVHSEGLDGFGEGDALQYSSKLIQRSRTRFESSHRWECGSNAVEVEMLSVFLRRRHGNANDLEEADPPSPADFRSDAVVSNLERTFRDQKRSRTGKPEIVHSCTWLPTLALDFNGARLLYFARYHQIVERAESSAFGETLETCYALQRRETCYFANLDPGESVTVSLSEVKSADAFRRHQAEISRVRDGRLMARVVTCKRRFAMHTREEIASPFSKLAGDSAACHEAPTSELGLGFLERH
jgi:probable biosynthetic protein (TIGR04099 family)